MRILVTRPRERAADLVARLEALGHEVVVCPLIRTESLGDDPVDVGGYEWVVVTSVTGAHELRRRARGRMPRVAAIGAATAQALGGADLVPARATQEGLLAELPPPSGRVLFAGAEGARRLIVEALDADFVPLYRTVPIRPAEPPDGDLAVLASASAARAFAALGLDLPAVTIGPQTTRAAAEGGVKILAEARTHDLEGLVEAVNRACSSRS